MIHLGRKSRSFVQSTLAIGPPNLVPPCRKICRNMKRNNQSSETSRKHSLAGCKTCRRRHLKCDQTEPTCNRCRIAGLDCEGFTPAFRWIVSTGPETDNRIFQSTVSKEDQHSRRQLYTEECRESMSMALTADIASTINDVLDQIDNSSKNLEAESADSLAIGPFCVFKTNGERPSSPDKPDITEVTQEYNATRSPIQFEEPMALDAVTSFHFSPESIDFLHWSDLFTWDTSFMMEDPSLRPPGSLQTQPQMGLLSESSWGLESPSNTYTMPETTFTTLPDTNPGIDDVLWPPIDLMLDAPLLLGHFNNHVIDQMGSLPIHEKSPWRTLSLPSATITLSQLTLLATERTKLKHANLSNFYALIAVSALHLSLNPIVFEGTARSPGYWKSVATQTYNAAKHHLKISLEKEIEEPTKAKYKQQLMAIHAILSTCVLTGDERDTQRYLTEAERLIRSRGLAKQVVSRRARTLHHIYAWMRIVSESTNILHGSRSVKTSALEQLRSAIGEDETRDKTIQLYNGRNNADVTLDNFLRIESRQADWDLNIHSQKDPGSSIHDIHLEDSRQGRDNMFMQIYGVPETWLSLLSQTTRLANVMDRLMTDNRQSNAETLLSLQTRASRLEDTICSFVAGSHSSSRFMLGNSQASSEAPQTTPHEHMLRALSSGLVIFFYRRIRNTNPWILRNNVTDVIESLKGFNQALEDHGLPGPGTAWPAFIAGAEATTTEQREYISYWLDSAYTKSRFASYRVAKEILLETWSKRDQATICGGRNAVSPQACSSPTWMDICKLHNRWPIFS